MKFTSAALVLVSSWLCADTSSAFQVAHPISSERGHVQSVLPQASKMAFAPSQSLMQSAASTALFSDFGSDFASAMPAKPELSLEERMWESAEQFIDTMSKCLGEGVEAPKELTALEAALEAKSDAQVMALRIYELMIERGMRYDEAPETGTLTPTEFDIKANLDVKEVRDEFAYLYKYGMMLMDRKLVSEDDVKTAVVDRLIARTGLSPEEFDKWLGY
eukprot:CAMPEP_0198123444 /NCGR_PEP_ID=MMETSP1442-20131203/37553_1 /TAXON_ID= /ORGANISM="Craspedostauros australis, Strain CCMP3328" /LENGTH=218 /DNA_ID=CAMNT_0043782651 /DNA_START=11 /DNA_END=667 /DNA_ORIENTATION=+